MLLIVSPHKTSVDIRKKNKHFQKLYAKTFQTPFQGTIQA